MSFAAERRNLAGVVLEAKAESNAQNLIRSLLNTFPDDFELSTAEHALTESLNHMNLDDQHSGMLTPINYDRSAASTPNLSLPDSFDVDCFNVVKDMKMAKEAKFPGPCRFPTTASVAKGTCDRCAEVEHKFTAEKAVLTNKCTELKGALDSALMKYDATYAELCRLQKMSGITEENQRLEIAALTDRCLRLSNLQESESALRRKYEDRANRFDTADAELQRMRKDTAELRATLEQQGKAVQILTHSENTARRTAEDAERVKELLQLDKAHLQQAVRALESRYDEKCRSAEHSHSQCLALEVKVAQLTDQLLSLQLTARSGFDERMDKEIQRLREENAREMEALKATSRDILDRENRVLREAKTSIEHEANQLRLRNDSLSQQVSQLQQELHALQHEKGSTISELRAELKMKAFELTTLGVSFEERMGQLRQSELEVEVMRQEISAHRSALLRLEGETQHDTNALRAELEQQTRRLRAYETLEEEIDGAVMRTAGLYGANHSDTHSSALVDSAEAAAQKLLQSVKGIPTNPERRVKQAVFLAQRLLESERQRDLLQSELKQVRADLTASKQQAQVAAENLTRAAQPTAYLVNKLRDEETAKAAFLNKCRSLEDEMGRCKHAELHARRESEQLKERLQSLLQQRGELETVKVMLAQLSAMEAQEDSSDSDGESSQEEPEERSYFSPQDRRGGAGNREEKRSSPSPVSSTHSAHSGSHHSSGNDRNNAPAHIAPTTPTNKGRNLQATAAALGLTPEQLEVMTSPPKHGHNDVHDVHPGSRNVTMCSPTK